MIRLKKFRKGVSLPIVLVSSLTIMIIMLALLAVASASYKSVYVNHYQKLSEEAAEAGSAYATACLSLSSHVQTWGPAASASNLTPNTDCHGTNTYPSNQYVYSNSSFRTYFIVGDLNYTVQFAAQISAQGFTELLRPDGSVQKTFTSIKKKVITWPTDAFAQISASGSRRTCATVSYKVYCWGYNAYGQLGNGQYIGSGSIESASSIDSLVPVKVFQATGVMANKQIANIFVAQYHSCALSTDGIMYCWGYNRQGQLGIGNTTDSPVPVQVGGALTGQVVTSIGGTGNTTCAIAGGKIYCWGLNDLGQAGQGYANSTYLLTPTLVSATNTSTTLATAYNATALSSGSRSSVMCAIVDGKAYCWGPNVIGSLGDGTTTPRYLPTKVSDTGVLSGKTVTSISQDGYISVPTGGYPHVCVVADGKAYCWGDDTFGQLGDGTTTTSSIPVAVVSSGVLSGKTVQMIRVGLNHSCVQADNSAYCWGINSSGQVGDGTTTSRSTPVAVARQAGNVTGSNVISIGAGSNRGCAVISDGRTFCWGLNSNGQIGDGTTINRTSPTESLFLRPVGNQYIF